MVVIIACDSEIPFAFSLRPMTWHTTYVPNVQTLRHIRNVHRLALRSARSSVGRHPLRHQILAVNAGVGGLAQSSPDVSLT